MSADTIENVWLQVGTDSGGMPRRTQAKPARPVPLRREGRGRLAVQKLGDTIRS